LQTNALKFTQRGSVVIHVEIIEIEIENKEFLEVSVIDTGIGIPYEN
jgi:signal transduction histidine kinase